MKSPPVGTRAIRWPALVFVVALAVWIVFLVLRSRGPAAPDDSALLSKMIDAGADMTLPHTVRFLLRVGSRGEAEAAALELQGEGFAAESLEDPPGTWRCRAVRNLVPIYAEFIRAREHLEGLARRHGGRYEGWEASVDPMLPLAAPTTPARKRRR